MPRPQRDGTPARAPNRRKLSNAFVRTVQPDPHRVVVYWDTHQRGLALAVQPSGHLAWKCIYRPRGRGPRWYSIGNARAISLADARRLAGKIMVAVAEGGDPHADRLALRGRGSFEQVAARYVEEHAKKKNKSWRQADALVRRYLLPRWAKLDIGNIRRADVKAAIAAIDAPVLANQVLAAASAIFSWALRQEIITANPCSGVERNDTTSRERILSDAEIVMFWPQLTPPLKAVLLTGQRPGEVAHLRREHVVDGGWWSMPGAPIPRRRGLAPRTNNPTASGCLSPFVSSSRTCSQHPCEQDKCNRTCATSAPGLACGRKRRRTICAGRSAQRSPHWASVAMP